MTRRTACSGKSRFRRLLAAAALLLTLLPFSIPGCDEGVLAAEDATFQVEPCALRISVVEGGSLESEDPRKIQSEVEGQATILWVVKEGTIVKAGDKLVELDVSSLTDKLTSQKIKVRDAVADKITAEQNLIIQQNLQASNIRQAELNRDFAKLELEKYEKGTSVQAKQEIDAEIKLAEAEIKRAADQLEWSKRLNAKGFLTRTELDADSLALQKREIDKELAQGKLEVFGKYTKTKDLAKLKAETEEAVSELLRVKAKAESALAQATADRDSQQAKLELEQSIEKKLENQIAKAVIKAPRDGLVVYWRESGGGMRGGNERPIEEGASIRERQTIISLPDLSKLIAKLSIHESAIEKISVGQPAILRFDAMANQPLAGVVSKVAPVPDSQSSWLNPDLKVYTTEVQILNLPPDHRLRPGMSASVEIIVEDLKDVVAVPLQAVRDNGLQHFCYVKESGKPAVREVKIGNHNNSLVHVKEGLKAKEIVYLTLKDPPALPEAKQVSVAIPKPPDEATVRSVPSRGREGDGNGGGPGGQRSGRPRMSEEERAQRVLNFIKERAPEKYAEYEAADSEGKKALLKEWGEEMRKMFRMGGGGEGGRPGNSEREESR